MGFVPDWIRSSMCKTGTATKDTAKPATKFGVVSRELFHGAQNFADGGEVNAKGETMGEYSGDDEIVKYRMNQIDDKGNDLRIPTSAKTTQSQMDVQDMENGSGSAPSRDFDAGPDVSSAPKSSPAKSSPAKSASSAKATPSRDFDAPDDGTTSPAASDARMKARAPASPTETAKTEPKKKATAADARAVIYGGDSSESFDSKLNKLGKRK